MNIAESIGVIPPLQWLFELLTVWGIPLYYGVGLLFPLGVLFTLALVFENRLLNPLRQYYSVTSGYLLLSVAIGIGLAIVDHLPDVQDVWYRDSWWAPLYHGGLIAFGLLMAIQLKWAEAKESRTKRAIWYAVHPDKEVPTDWLNSEHINYFTGRRTKRLDCTKRELCEWLRNNNRLNDDTSKLVASLKFGVAYSRRQQWSFTALGHPLVAAAMTYLTGLVVSVVITKIVVHGWEIQQPWWYVGGVAAMLIALFLWYRTTTWDNTRVRPVLTDVHPDEYPLRIIWMPIRALVRLVRSRTSSPQYVKEFSDFGYGPQERDGAEARRLADDLFEPTPPDTDQVYRASFGGGVGTEEERPSVADAPLTFTPIFPPDNAGGEPDHNRFGTSTQACLVPPEHYAVPDSGQPHVPPAPPVPTVQQEPCLVTPSRTLSGEESQTVRQSAIAAADPRKQPPTSAVGSTQSSAPEQPAERATGMRLGTSTSPASGELLRPRANTQDSGGARATGMRLTTSDASGSRNVQGPGAQTPPDAGRATGMRLGTSTSPASGELLRPRANTQDSGGARATGMRLRPRDDH